MAFYLAIGEFGRVTGESYIVVFNLAKFDGMPIEGDEKQWSNQQIF